jgi:hypothetical protein
MILNKKIMFLVLVATFLVLQKNSYGIGGKLVINPALPNEEQNQLAQNPAAPQQFEMGHFHSYWNSFAAPMTNDPVSLRRVAEEQINILQSV